MLAGQVALELMSLDASGDEHVTLFVDSGAGTLDAAFTVIDVIDLLGVPGARHLPREGRRPRGRP